MRRPCSRAQLQNEEAVGAGDGGMGTRRGGQGLLTGPRLSVQSPARVMVATVELGSDARRGEIALATMWVCVCLCSISKPSASTTPPTGCQNAVGRRRDSLRYCREPAQRSHSLAVRKPGSHDLAGSDQTDAPHHCGCAPSQVTPLSWSPHLRPVTVDPRVLPRSCRPTARCPRILLERADRP